MKILFVAHVSDLYGANKSLISLIKALQKDYDINPFVLLPGKGEALELLKKSEIPFLIWKYWGWQQKDNKIIKNIIIRIWNKMSAIFLGIIFRYQKFDGIHSNSSVTNMGALLAQRIKCKHIWHLREFGEEDYDLKYIHGYAEINETYKQAVALIAISNAVKEKYKLFLQDSNIVLIYNGINMKKYDKVYAINRTKVKFCCVGILSKKKGQLDIIEACHILKEHKITEFCVNIIGDGDRTLKESIINKITEYQLEKQVILWGRKENIEDILKDMDVGLMTSENEAFGRVTIEYMLSGMPVIGASSGGTKELIQDNINGKLYQSGNCEQLSKAMYEFIQNPDCIQKMGKFAGDFAYEKFSMEKYSSQIYKLYQRYFSKRI